MEISSESTKISPEIHRISKEICRGCRKGAFSNFFEIKSVKEWFLLKKELAPEAKDFLISKKIDVEKISKLNHNIIYFGIYLADYLDEDHDMSIEEAIEKRDFSKVAHIDLVEHLPLLTLHNTMHIMHIADSEFGLYFPLLDILLYTISKMDRKIEECRGEENIMAHWESIYRRHGSISDDIPIDIVVKSEKLQSIFCVNHWKQVPNFEKYRQYKITLKIKKRTYLKDYASKGIRNEIREAKTLEEVILLENYGSGLTDTAVREAYWYRREDYCNEKGIIF